MGTKSKDSQYHQLHKDLAGKREFKKYNFLLNLLLSGVVSFMVLAFFGGTVFSTDWFIIHWSELKFNFDTFSIELGDKLEALKFREGEEFMNYNFLVFVLFPIIFLTYIFFTFKSEEEYKRIAAYKKKKPCCFKIRYAIVRNINKIFKPVFNFISFFFLPDSVDDKIKERFFLRFGWFSHLENAFFKRVFHKADSYKKVKELNLLKDYPRLLSYSGQPTELSYNFIINMFGNDIIKLDAQAAFEDIMKITEGYLEKPKKYDKVLTKEEYKEMLKKNNNNIYKLKMFNEKDTVYFSFDLIVDLINKETEKYEEFLDKAWISRVENGLRGSSFLKKINKYFISFIEQRPEYIAEAFFQNEEYKANSVQKVEEILKEKNIEKSILKLLMMTRKVLPYYFRAVLIREIFNQYTFIPSGTYVSRLNNYNLKMIYEIVDSKKIIEIVKNKNDGSSKSFKSDVFVNLFLFTYYYYGENYNVNKFTLGNRLESIFNFQIKKIAEDVFADVENPFEEEFFLKKIEEGK